MKLTTRFGDALRYAFDLHASQVRKGSLVPYFAHLAGVSSLVLEYNGDEDEAVAGLLHDAVEDQGGSTTLKAIETRFGSRVAAIVEGCTDSFEEPKPPWRARKERYLRHLAMASKSVQLVAACDKLYNLGAILRDYRLVREQIWTRFTGGRDGVMWYYGELVAAFPSTNPVVEDLRRMVRELESTISLTERHP